MLTAVTEHPTAAWLSQQLTEAFPWDTAPRYLLRDRDASYGSEFCNRVGAMGITEAVTAPHSPWQNAYVERVIGSIRRECLDHIVIFNERHLRRVLSAYVAYYHRSRTHLSLDKDCPDSRPIMPRRIGKVVAIPKVGGLHHHYQTSRRLIRTISLFTRVARRTVRVVRGLVSEGSSTSIRGRPFSIKSIAILVAAQTTLPIEFLVGTGPGEEGECQEIVWPPEMRDRARKGSASFRLEATF